MPAMCSFSLTVLILLDGGLARLTGPLTAIHEIGTARQDDLAVLAPNYVRCTARRMDVDVPARFALIGAQNGRAGRAGARSGRFARAAFPDTDLDIFRIDDADKNDICSLGVHRVRFHLATDIAPLVCK